MTDLTVKTLDQCQSIFGGHYKRVRAGLGVTSFGIAVIDLPAGSDSYPEHDQSHDGQEEVYTALEGRATIQVAGDDHELAPGVWIRVGPQERRRVITHLERVRILTIGATPEQPYRPPDFTEEGTPVWSSA